MMNCSSCKTEWPDGVKFCGRCGEKLVVDSGTLSPAQAKVNQQLQTLLPKIGLGKFTEVEPGHHICAHGSTHVDVRVVKYGEQVAVRSTAPVTIGSNMTADLMKFLLINNAAFLFGAFAIDPKGVVIYSHTIVASSMDANELSASVKSVVLMADAYDDQIVKRWGGKTMKDTVLSQVLPERLLQLLRQ